MKQVLKTVVCQVKRMIASPKTTAAGLAAVAVGAAAFWKDPIGFLSNPQDIMPVLVGVGLLFAADTKAAE